MSYFDMVEQAWCLSDEIREYVKKSDHDVSVDEVWERFFSSSPLVDVDATNRLGGAPLSKVFFVSPYGLYYKPETKDWIPFRHGEVVIAMQGGTP